MADVSKKSSQTVKPSSSLVDLAGMLGTSSSLSADGIDARLLWMTVVALLNSGASFQIATNKARTSLVLTIYDGDYPHKEYCDTVDRAHFVMAAIVKSYLKRGIPPEWAEVVEMYFPR